MILFPHNQQAVNAVLKHYNNGHTKAAVVHATGTGKSYIIASVIERYNKCLVIAPNDYVLAETQKLCKTGTEFVTYAAAMCNNVTATDYDLIVLDEFHRAGAPEWGAGVSAIIGNNPNALLLGTTATDIRYLDGMRNMSDELFDGNVVSRLSLAEAWAMGILTPPVYITGLYTFDNVAETFINRVKNNSRMDKEKKARAISEMEGIRLDWAKADGLPKIFKRHLRKDTKRIIIFCEHFKNIEDVKTQAIQWISKAGFNIFRTYSVGYCYNNSNSELYDFSIDGYSGLKVMFSVNKLNEGVHIPNVDAVIMLRPTTSKIIHLQQIGRCMSSSENNRPIIFDFVDNLTKSSAVREIYREYNAVMQRQREKYDFDTKPTYDFVIEDYMVETRRVIETLESSYFITTFEDKMAEIEQWCETNGRYPTGKRKPVLSMTKEENLEHNYNAFLYRNRNREEVIALRNKYITFQMMTDEEKIEITRQWVADYKRRPHEYRGPIAKCNVVRRNEHNIARFINTHKDNEELSKILEDYPEFRHTNDDDKFMALTEWCESHNTYPVYKRGDPYETTLARYSKSHISEPKFAELLNKYGYKSIEDTYQENRKKFIAFCNKHNRLPRNKVKEENSLYNFARCVKRRKDDPEVIALYDKYKAFERKSCNIRLVELKEFCETYSRIPNDDFVLGDYERVMFSVYKRLMNTPEVVELRNKYVKKTALRTTEDGQMIRELRKQQLIEFVNANGFLPRHSEGKEKILANYWSRFRNIDEEVARIYAEYPAYQQYSLQRGIERVREFILLNHRPPRPSDDRYLSDLYYKRLRNNKEFIELVDSLKQQNPKQP